MRVVAVAAVAVVVVVAVVAVAVVVATGKMETAEVVGETAVPVSAPRVGREVMEGYSSSSSMNPTVNSCTTH